MKTPEQKWYWMLPPVLCVLVYLPGLLAWFQQDDFAWLGLSLSIHDARTLFDALFAPMAQGTIRPLSERLFFLVFHEVFGVTAFPFRLWVFLTQSGSLVLLSLITRRLTGSRLAGLLAPVLWVLNSGLAVSMAWTSAYNQVLCGFFLLAAFYCLTEWTATGNRRWMWVQWAAFAGALGSLEIAVMYPLLAALYVWLWARKAWRTTIPLFAGSAMYVLLHYFLAPYESNDPQYLLHFGISTLQTFASYWRVAMGPANIAEHFGSFPGWVGPVGTAIVTAGVVAAVIWSVRKRRWVPVFGLAWFVATLAPVLPLRDHFSSYYLTLPAAGLALAGGAAVAAAMEVAGLWRVAAVCVALVYAVAGAFQGSLGSRAVAERSWRIRTVVLGAQKARQQFPKRMIVLAGVDSQLFWTGIFDRPFRVLGITGVYLEPGSEKNIERHPEWGSVSDFVVPASALKDALERREAVVYAVEPRRLRGATVAYLIKAREEWRSEEPWRVDAGNPAFAGQLGPEWFGIDHGQRWMPKLATFRVRGPRTADERLYLTGWCPPEQVEHGALRVHVWVERKALKEIVVLKAPGVFSIGLDLPIDLVDARSVEVTLEAERTFRVPPDRRDLALVFGSFEVRR